MPSLLIKIRKSKRYKHQSVPWLADNELQADALHDLKTSNNCLSVWQIADDESNLTRVLTALAANCEVLSYIDYVLVTEQHVTEIHVRQKQTPGQFADKSAAENWHHDLIELSADKVMELAKVIQHKETPRRLLEKRIVKLIADGIDSGMIDRAAVRLKPSSLEKVDQQIASRRA